MIFVPIIFLMLAVVLTVLIAHAIGKAIRRRREAVVLLGPLRPLTSTPEPHCGNCGYIVRGIVSLTCPECGSDLREVGIDNGRSRRTLAIPLVLAIGWSAAVLPIGISTYVAAEGILPVWCRVSHSATLTSPLSRAYRGVSVAAGGTVRESISHTGQFDPSDVTVQLMTLQGQTTTATVNLKTGTWWYRGTGGERVDSPRAFGLAEGLAWMKAADVDTSQPQVSSEVLEILGVLRAQPVCLPGGSFRIGGRGTFVSFHDGSDIWSSAILGEGWSAAAAVVFWAVVWLAGLRWIITRYVPGK